MKTLSVIIPVYHEGRGINPLVEALSSHLEDGDEIIIVDGAQGMDTLRALRFPEPLRLASPAGRAVQMNLGAEHARGDIFVFVHADTKLPPLWRESVLQAAGGHAFKAGAFDLVIDSPYFWSRVMEKTANLRTHYTRVPYGDQVLFFDSSYFWSLGGFAPIPIMEDVELMTRIKKQGDRIVLLNTRVRTSARRWEKEGVLKGMLRNWLLRLLYHCGCKPETLAGMYRTY
jgi:rSAM/selenodomain-associated transferase 2